MKESDGKSDQINEKQFWKKVTGLKSVKKFYKKKKKGKLNYQIKIGKIIIKKKKKKLLVLYIYIYI